MSPGDQHGMGRTWRADEVPNIGDSIPRLGVLPHSELSRLMRAFLVGASTYGQTRPTVFTVSVCICVLGREPSVPLSVRTPDEVLKVGLYSFVLPVLLE